MSWVSYGEYILAPRPTTFRSMSHSAKDPAGTCVPARCSPMTFAPENIKRPTGKRILTRPMNFIDCCPLFCGLMRQQLGLNILSDWRVSMSGSHGRQGSIKYGLFFVSKARLTLPPSSQKLVSKLQVPFRSFAAFFPWSVSSLRKTR